MHELKGTNLPGGKRARAERQCGTTKTCWNDLPDDIIQKILQGPPAVPPGDVEV